MTDPLALDDTAVRWSAPEAERAGRPLLVLLHGLGADENDLMGLAPALPPEFVLAAVRAPLRWVPGRAWFEPDWSRPLEESVAPAGRAADALANWVAAHRAGHPAVGLLGFSQGAMISALALRRHPELADFAVLLSGGLFPRDEAGDGQLAARRTPVFLGYGEADPVVPAAMFVLSAAKLPTLAAAEVHAYPGLAHGISERELHDVAAFLAARLPG
ncbi:MAG: dienelactone hydrolase family protein [Actinomycetales bacterium]|nr:dienelactone hydrolase family protein [Actinomycetales bacterium]